jgi:tetratricopeptide (TPR) repeat protein
MGDPSAAGPSLEGMQGDSVGESFGSGGLGLSGAGNGGGGTGDGIGLGGVGTLGRGAGAAAGQGFGAGQGRLGGSHRARPPSVRMGATTVNGRLPPEVIQRIVRQNFGRFRLCYENGLRNNPNLEGRVSTRFIITKDGSVSGVANAGSSLPDAGVVACVVRSFTSLSFPQPEGGIVTVVYPISFAPGDGGGTSRSGPEPEPIERPSTANPYSGRFKSVMDALARQDTKGALASAESWHREAPGDVLGLIALGEGLEAVGDTEGAARAYGSLIDLFPARADMRRFAGERLERLKGETALALAIDTYTQAREQRPDHPASHRLLGFALLRKGDHKRAFEVVAEGLKRDYPPGRFAGVKRILAEDLGLIAAVWAQAEPARRGEIMAQLKAAGGAEEKGPSLRFVLNWETDANDVDFHIYDEKGHHAFYGHKHLASGGDLYADVTTGYGPECFTVRKGKSERAAAYTLQANYYSRGPMGYGMGKLEVIDHDGRGHLTFDERPYVVMIDHAFVDLGVIKR